METQIDLKAEITWIRNVTYKSCRWVDHFGHWNQSSRGFIVRTISNAVNRNCRSLGCRRDSHISPIDENEKNREIDRTSSLILIEFNWSILSLNRRRIIQCYDDVFFFFLLLILIHSPRIDSSYLHFHLFVLSSVLFIIDRIWTFKKWNIYVFETKDEWKISWFELLAFFFVMAIGWLLGGGDRNWLVDCLIVWIFDWLKFVCVCLCQLEFLKRVNKKTTKRESNFRRKENFNPQKS